MGKLRTHRVLIWGIVSPLLAVVAYVLVYNALLAISRDHQKDWLLRLAISAAAMCVPFLVALWLALKDRRTNALTTGGKVGMGIAALSLGLVFFPARDGFTRLRQTRNMEMRDVAAPVFDTADISGRRQQLEEQRGKLVVLNIWATWCLPCRDEMPKLDRLYRARSAEGLVVYGLSDESIATQQKFLRQVPVSYPLLTMSGTIPALYREISVYPATFLIDRQGRLQPGPGPGQPFEKLEGAVGALLKRSD